MMKLAIFGATGRTGQHLVEQALDAGHQVVAFTRKSSKLDIQHENLSVVEGDLQKPESVQAAVAGSDAVLSVLGPSSNSPEYPISQGINIILTAMEKHGVQRLIVSAGAGVSDPNDDPGLANKAITLLLKLISPHVYTDMQRTVAAVRASDLDWTVVRVPMLNDGPRSGEVRVGYVGKGVGPRLNRADMAAFMLEQLDRETYVYKAPVISN